VFGRYPEALLAFREAMKHQGERSDLGNNVPEVGRQDRGNSRAYSIDRVKLTRGVALVAAPLEPLLPPPRGRETARRCRIGRRRKPQEARSGFELTHDTPCR